MSKNIGKQRDDSFDLLKGFAIILMIVGRCEVSPVLHSFIYSFHMPLFFFVAGYFLKIRSIKEEILLSSKRLLMPYAVVASCICLLSVFYAAAVDDISHYTWADGSLTWQIVIKYLLGFNGEREPYWLIGGVGPFWFILAMFWGRLVTIFLIRKTNNLFFVSLLLFILGILGIVLNKYFFIPWCIPQGFCASGFIYVGWVIRKYELIEKYSLKRTIPLLMVVWLYSCSRGGVAMADCWFSIGFAFSLLGALGAFFALHSVVVTFYARESFLWRCIHFWGRYSLIIYSVHAFEGAICNWRVFTTQLRIPLEYHGLFQVSVRLLIAFVFSYILLKIRPIKEQIFQIRD